MGGVNIYHITYDFICICTRTRVDYMDNIAISDPPELIGVWMFIYC